MRTWPRASRAPRENTATMCTAGGFRRTPSRTTCRRRFVSGGCRARAPERAPTFLTKVDDDFGTLAPALRIQRLGESPLDRCLRRLKRGAIHTRPRLELSVGA